MHLDWLLIYKILPCGKPGQLSLLHFIIWLRITSILHKNCIQTENRSCHKIFGLATAQICNKKKKKPFLYNNLHFSSNVKPQVFEPCLLPCIWQNNTYWFIKQGNIYVPSFIMNAIQPCQLLISWSVSKNLSKSNKYHPRHIINV